MSGLPTGRSLVRGGHHREAVGPVIVVDRVVGVDGVPGDAGRVGVNARVATTQATDDSMMKSDCELAASAGKAGRGGNG